MKIATSAAMRAALSAVSLVAILALPETKNNDMEDKPAAQV